MEGAPSIPSIEKKEQAADWRTLKTEAPQKAKALISDIEGYDTLEVVAQVAELTKLIDRLAQHNSNRFVAGEIARTRAILIETAEHTARMTQLTA